MQIDIFKEISFPSLAAWVFSCSAWSSCPTASMTSRPTECDVAGQDRRHAGQRAVRRHADHGGAAIEHRDDGHGGRAGQCWRDRAAAAISIIMGANIGTTLGNGLIALPLGPLGLILAGIFALVYVFSKSRRPRISR